MSKPSRKRGPGVRVVTRDAQGKVVKVELRKTHDLQYVRYGWEKQGDYR